MKTSELIGPTLNWAVAVAEGYVIGDYEGREGSVACRYKTGEVRFIKAGKGPCTDILRCGYWRPSTDPSQSWTIIERERISVGTALDAGYWLANPLQGKGMTGPTSLIAAMRAFVASKLGDDVIIPEALL